MAPEEVVGMGEPDGVPGSDGGVAEDLGQEALADAGGTHQQDVLVPVQELQGEDGVQQSRRCMVMDANQSKSSRQAGLLKAGTLQPHLDAPVGPAVDLVAEDDFQEGGVVQLLPAGQGDALGQGGGHGPQLEPFEQGCEFNDAGHG